MDLEWLVKADFCPSVTQTDKYLVVLMFSKGGPIKMSINIVKNIEDPCGWDGSEPVACLHLLKL